VKDHESSGSLDSVLPVVPKDVLIGIRQVLEAGMEPQELAKRLGAMIDTVVGASEVSMVAVSLSPDSAAAELLSHDSRGIGMRAPRRCNTIRNHPRHPRCG
jgi:hypothetical protein